MQLPVGGSLQDRGVIYLISPEIFRYAGEFIILLAVSYPSYIFITIYLVQISEVHINDNDKRRFMDRKNKHKKYIALH